MQTVTDQDMPSLYKVAVGRHSPWLAAVSSFGGCDAANDSAHISLRLQRRCISASTDPFAQDSTHIMPPAACSYAIKKKDEIERVAKANR